MRVFVVEAGLWWAGLVGVWLITLPAVTWPEVWVSAAAAVPCALLTVRARHAMEQSWGVDFGWLRGVAVVPIAVLADVLRVLALPLRTVRAKPRKHDLQSVLLSGPRRGPAAETRRAAATVLVSATPATVVIDSDPEDHALVVHRLASGPPDMGTVMGR